MKKIWIPLLLTSMAQWNLIQAQEPGARRCTQLKINNIQHKKGKLWLSFYKDKNTFPDTASQNYSQALSAVSDSVQTINICGLEAGWYAVTVFQDLDNDKQMTTNGLAQPKEPYGYSNNVHFKAIAPTFNQCKIFIEPGKQTTIDISLVNPK